MCRRLMKQIERKFKNYVQNIENGTVYVQHDGASPHRTAAVEHEIQRIGLECTPRVIWIRQTPRSPEFNANDLAVYKHLGSTVEASDYRTSEELVGAVGLAWQAMPSKLLERVYAMKMIVLALVKKNHGSAIQIPHTQLRMAQDCGQLWEFVAEFVRFCEA